MPRPILIAYPCAVLRVLLLLGWGGVMIMCAYFAHWFRYKQYEKIPALFHRGCCFILAIKIEIDGELTTRRPTLFVSNHVSYLDIIILGGFVPGVFIAKSEVASWPVLGFLAKLQNTLFFERNSVKVAAQIQTMQQHLQHDGNLILFPEGTSTEGSHVEPFKSSLFAAVDLPDKVVAIQAMTVAYIGYRGKNMSREERDGYAWYGTMPFFSHFLRVTALQGCTVKLIFHPPVEQQSFESRKACAAYCWKSVAASLADVIPIHEVEENDYAESNKS